MQQRIYTTRKIEFLKDVQMIEDTQFNSPEVRYILLDILNNLKEQKSLTITTKLNNNTSDQQVVIHLEQERELSTQKAADFLNISRPFLIKLLERGELKFRKVGKHRRVNQADVIAYKQKQEEALQAAFSELVAIAQKNNMGY